MRSGASRFKNRFLWWIEFKGILMINEWAALWRIQLLLKFFKIDFLPQFLQWKQSKVFILFKNSLPHAEHCSVWWRRQRVGSHNGICSISWHKYLNQPLLFGYLSLPGPLWRDKCGKIKKNIFTMKPNEIHSKQNRILSETK